MPGEGGDIISSVAPDIHDITDGLQEAVNGMSEFDATTLRADMTTAWTQLEDYINNKYYSITLDWSSTANLNILKALANPTSSSDYDGCTVNGFASDSWIPSIASGAKVSCYSSAGVDVDDTQCSSQAIITQGAASGGACYGCIDSFKVLGVISGTIATDLNTRYTGGHADCGTFATDMATLWTNYYAIK